MTDREPTLAERLERLDVELQDAFVHVVNARIGSGITGDEGPLLWFELELSLKRFKQVAEERHAVKRLAIREAMNSPTSIGPYRTPERTAPSLPPIPPEVHEAGFRDMLRSIGALGQAPPWAEEIIADVEDQ